MPPVIHSALLNHVAGVRHAFFTRQGGASKGRYASLNLGRGSQDDPADVEENRAIAAGFFGAEASDLNTCFQIHSTITVVADGAWCDKRPHGDAVISQTPGVICGALSADCAPVLIADGQAGIVAAAHAGWRGALDGIVQAAVKSMVALGADPGRMVAAVGPCIGPDSYEVGLEFLEKFEADAPGSGQFFRPGRSEEKRMFDLPAFVLARLRTAGVAQHEWTGHDTCTNEALFFSNRRAVIRKEGDYGRLLSAISLV
ncbi:MAG: peptidoglycan editing factor PgeF [Alphaproteobacteria bacterium]